MMSKGVSECVDEIFTLKQIGKKAREKRKKIKILYVDFMDLEKMYDGVHRKVLWQVLWKYDVGGKFFIVL